MEEMGACARTLQRLTRAGPARASGATLAHIPLMHPLPLGGPTPPWPAASLVISQGFPSLFPVICHSPSRPVFLSALVLSLPHLPLFPPTTSLRNSRDIAVTTHIRCRNSPESVYLASHTPLTTLIYLRPDFLDYRAPSRTFPLGRKTVASRIAKLAPVAIATTTPPAPSKRQQSAPSLTPRQQ